MRQKTSKKKISFWNKRSQWGKQTSGTWAIGKRILNTNKCSKIVEETNTLTEVLSTFWCRRNLDQKQQKRKTQNHETLERWQETMEKTCLQKSGLNSTRIKTTKILQRQQETKEKTWVKMKSYKSPKVEKISSLMEDQQNETKTHNNGESNIS